VNIYEGKHGMPLNLPSHAHGEGNADMNTVIPEFVRRLNYEKGPYYAEGGNYSSAGLANLEFFKTLSHNFFQVEGGMYGYGRTAFGVSQKFGSDPCPPRCFNRPDPGIAEGMKARLPVQALHAKRRFSSRLVNTPNPFHDGIPFFPAVVSKTSVAATRVWQRVPNRRQAIV
jgi:hypothetical protein